MEEAVKDRLTSPGIWWRALYMVLFAVAFSIAKTIIVFLVIIQFLSILVTGGANEPLLKFGTNLSTYVYQILQFQTFNTETQPFPFSDWPDEAAGGDRWLQGRPTTATDADRERVVETQDEQTDMQSSDEPAKDA